MSDGLGRSHARLTTAQALIGGGLTVGTLDILDAILFFGVRSNVSPVRILQSIAAGVLGRASFQGGLAAAALGLLLHFTIAFTIVLVFFSASRRIPQLTRRPLLWGPIYGLLVYVVMNFIVIPLSAADRGNMVLPVVINGMLIHVLGVGLPAALFARAASGLEPAGSARVLSTDTP